MKKTYILIAIFCMCILFVGCGNVEDTDTSVLPVASIGEQEDVSSKPLDESSGLTSDIPDNSSGLTSDIPDNSFTSSSSSNNSGTDSSLPGDGGVCVYPRPDGCYGIEEYNKFMETNEAPIGFVKYEEIAVFGDFDILMFPIFTDSGNRDYSEYRYILVNKYGRKTELDICQDDEFFRQSDIGELSIEDVNTTDMRRLKNGTRGIFEYEGIWYRYTRDGELSRIGWVAFGKVYILSLYELIWVSTLEDGSIEQRLLNIETARDALIEVFGEGLGR